MNKSSAPLVRRSEKWYASLLTDVLCLTLIWSVPHLSGWLGFPLYYVEPVRLVLVLTIVFTNRTNVLFMAVVVPLFSYFLAYHPSIPKSLLLMAELLVNAFLFYYFFSLGWRILWSIFVSILVAKLFYYLLKYLFILMALLEFPLISTPLEFQVITLLVYSGFVTLVLTSRKR